MLIGQFEAGLSELDYELKLVGKGKHASIVIAKGTYARGAPLAPLEGGAKDIPGAAGAKYIDIKTTIAIDSDKVREAVFDYKYFSNGRGEAPMTGRVKVSDE